MTDARHPPILILARSESEMLLRSPAGSQIKAAISIHGSHEPPLNATGIPHTLILHFDDIDALDPANPLDAQRMLSRQRQSAETGQTLVPPTIEDAQAIVNFARRIADLNGTVLCQCQGGISRSPAAAFICLATWTGQGHEQYCAEHLLQVRPSAAPLLSLVRFADQLLNRHGTLVQALSVARASRP